MKRKLLWTFICVLTLFISFCEKPPSSSFNHNRTLFPLTGSHQAASCRECHKDGAITTLSTACSSCHPMSIAHTKNLGDCNLCHTTVTFSAAYFNHSRLGAIIGGVHKLLVADSCTNCHTPNTYSGVNFTCSNCHAPHIIDGTVHTSATVACDRCHNQVTFSPAAFTLHNSYATKLAGSHTTLSCSKCHNTPFGVWTNINYRDGLANGSCARCHTRDYDFGEDDHNGLPADANCGSCHGYGFFD